MEKPKFFVHAAYEHDSQHGLRVGPFVDQAIAICRALDTFEDVADCLSVEVWCERPSLFGHSYHRIFRRSVPW